MMKISSNGHRGVEFIDVVQHKNEGGPRPIDDIQYSPDGCYLAAVTHKHRLQLYNTDSYQLIAKLPRLNDAHLPRFCFDSHSSQIILYCSQDREVFLYNLKNQQLSTLGSLDCTPSKKPRGTLFLSPAHAVVPVPTRLDMFALHDTHNLVFVCYRDSRRTVKGGESPKVGAKRGKGSKQISTHVISAYREMLSVSVLHSGALLVVEKPWTNVLQALPPALVRDRYGT